MKPKSLLILTVLVAALGAFVWFGRELPSTDELEAREKRVLSIEPEEVMGLEIERGAETVALTRLAEVEPDETSGATAGEWQLDRPVVARADSAVVDGLMRRLATLEKERTLEDVERAAVGLDEPRARVRLTTDVGETVLEIGAEVPASSTMTLAIEGEPPVYVVASSIWSDLTREPSEWRDKNLFTGQRAAIERIVLDRSGERVVLARRGDDFWVESPLADRADQIAVNALVSAITGLRAERFVGPGEVDAGQLGLDPPVAAIEVALAGGASPMRLQIGARETATEESAAEAGAAIPGGEGQQVPPTYLAADGEIVTTRATLTEHALRAADEWRSKDLVSGEVYELRRVEVEDRAGRTELVRVDNEWTRDGEPIEYGVATDLLYEISGGAAARVVDGESLGDLGAPTLSFGLFPEPDEGGEPVEAEMLRLYAPIGDETPARVSGREAVLMLSAEAATGLRDKLSALRTAPRREVNAPDDTDASVGQGAPGGA